MSSIINHQSTNKPELIDLMKALSQALQEDKNITIAYCWLLHSIQSKLSFVVIKLKAGLIDEVAASIQTAAQFHQSFFQLICSKLD